MQSCVVLFVAVEELPSTEPSHEQVVIVYTDNETHYEIQSVEQHEDQQQQEIVTNTEHVIDDQVEATPADIPHVSYWYNSWYSITLY